MNCRSMLILLSLAVSIAVSGESSQLRFNAGGVTLTDVQPGTQFAWMAMVLEQRDYQEKARVVHGVGMATLQGLVELAVLGDDAIWAVAGIDGDVVLTATTPTLAGSTRPIEVVAQKGTPSLVITSARAEVLYVRRGSAWTFSGADGGRQDADGISDGRITVGISSMVSLHGNQPSPTVVESGDVILIIDFTTRRSSAIRVSR